MFLLSSVFRRAAVGLSMMMDSPDQSLRLSFAFKSETFTDSVWLKVKDDQTKNIRIFKTLYGVQGKHAM